MARYESEYDRDHYGSGRDQDRDRGYRGQEHRYGAGRDLDDTYRQDNDRRYGGRFGGTEAEYESRYAEGYQQRDEYPRQGQLPPENWQNRGYERDYRQYRGRRAGSSRGYAGDDFTSPRDFGNYGRSGQEWQDRDWGDRAVDEVKSWFGDDDAERRRRQDHRGHGPKNYQRSDARIEEEINDRLTDDSHVDASHIEVSVSDREVTLTGTVSTKGEKRRAEDCADEVSGVSYVQNNLRISAEPKNTDNTLTGAGNTLL